MYQRSVLQDIRSRMNEQRKFIHLIDDLYL